MKKILVVFIILVISLSSVFAVTETTNEADLNIKAYKIGNYDTKYITLSVFDALVGDLDTIKKDDKIDITSYTKDLLNPYKNDSSYSVEPYADHVIFSLRISGNSSTPEGGMKCTVEITPLQKTDENNGVIPTIDTYYEMRDVSCVFTSNYKTTTDTNGITALTIGTRSGSPTETSNLTMDFAMKINVGGDDAFENWRTLASVGVSIGNKSYDEAKTGSYYATVKIGVVTK